MAPFPEAEDMTIKRLYVALKRGDMQLLQMGAHKLHEKFHTGHKFELLDDLKQILSYVEEQPIQNDVKDLLIRTINDILNGTIPQDEPVNTTENQFLQDLTPQTENNSLLQTTKEDIDHAIFTPKDEQNAWQNNEKPQPVRIITDETSQSQNETTQQTLDLQSENTSKQNASYENLSNIPTEQNADFQNLPQNNEQPDSLYPSNEQEPEINSSLSLQNEQAQTESEVQIAPPVQNEINQNEQTEKNEPVIQNEPFEQNEPVQNETNEDATPQNLQTVENENIQNQPVFTANEPFLNNVAVFYDDKASFIDYLKNLKYKIEFNKVLLNQDAAPVNNAADVKSVVDIPTDEINEILKMLNMIKGNVYFITTSKSENIIKTFIECGINFQIPLVTNFETTGKNTVLIPLFGLSNIYICPKCSQREYFGGLHNKVLTLQCKNCNSTMYPDIYEAQNFDTNANPYYWIYALNVLAKSDTWILVNPPLESSRALAAMFIKSAFEMVHPKKVYILSKETTKREYYKQIFKEADSNCIIKADYQTQDGLCEEFINCEMSAVRVNA